MFTCRIVPRYDCMRLNDKAKEDKPQALQSAQKRLEHWHHLTRGADTARQQFRNDICEHLAGCTHLLPYNCGPPYRS